MGETVVSLSRSAFLGSVLLPSCALTCGLWWWKRMAFCFAALPLFVAVGVVAAASLQQFVQGKHVRRRQRGQARPDTILVSRALYNQLDADTLQLLVSSRDFGEHDYERLLQLDSVRHGGATETEIQRLPLVPFTKHMQRAANHAGCAICLSPIDLGSSVRLLSCFHHFHPNCIDPWLKGKAECPMCKLPAIG